MNAKSYFNCLDKLTIACEMVIMMVVRHDIEKGTKSGSHKLKRPFKRSFDESIQWKLGDICNTYNTYYVIAGGKLFGAAGMRIVESLGGTREKLRKCEKMKVLGRGSNAVWNSLCFVPLFAPPSPPDQVVETPNAGHHSFQNISPHGECDG